MPCFDLTACASALHAQATLSSRQYSAPHAYRHVTGIPVAGGPCNPYLPSQKPSTQGHSSPRLFKARAASSSNSSGSSSPSQSVVRQGCSKLPQSPLPCRESLRFSPLLLPPTEQSTCSSPPFEVLQSDSLRGLLLLACLKKKEKRRSINLIWL